MLWWSACNVNKSTESLQIFKVEYNIVIYFLGCSGIMYYAMHGKGDWFKNQNKIANHQCLFKDAHSDFSLRHFYIEHYTKGQLIPPRTLPRCQLHPRIRSLANVQKLANTAGIGNHFAMSTVLLCLDWKEKKPGPNDLSPLEQVQRSLKHVSQVWTSRFRLKWCPNANRSSGKTSVVCQTLQWPLLRGTTSIVTISVGGDVIVVSFITLPATLSVAKFSVTTRLSSPKTKSIWLRPAGTRSNLLAESQNCFKQAVVEAPWRTTLTCPNQPCLRRLTSYCRILFLAKKSWEFSLGPKEPGEPYFFRETTGFQHLSKILLHIVYDTSHS